MSVNAGLCTKARPSRRAVTRAAAWTVPVIAVASAAPAYAASPCDAKSVTMDWGNGSEYTRNSETKATYTIPDPDGAGPGQKLELTVTNTFLGTNTKLGNQANNVNDNMRTATGQGGSSQSNLCLHQSPKVDSAKVSTWTGTTNKSITTFSFSRPVTNLTFTIRDIDSAINDFWDAIAITGPAFIGTRTNAAYVSGTGALNDPYRSSGPQLPIDGTSDDGNVVITMAAAQTFELHYWNLKEFSASGVDGDQRVFLSNFSMSYKPC